MHTNPPANSQQQQTMPMDGVSNNGPTGGQQPMEITSTAPQDSTSTANGNTATPQPQPQTKLSQNVFVHKLYKYAKLFKTRWFRMEVDISLACWKTRAFHI